MSGKKVHFTWEEMKFIHLQYLCVEAFSLILEDLLFDGVHIYIYIYYVV